MPNSVEMMSTPTDFTIKKCMPIFDSMVLGYILKVPDDIKVYKTETKDKIKTKLTNFQWRSLSPITSHDLSQVKEYPHNKVHKIGIPKIVNPWIIKTPPGYSCLFITPMHRDLPFSIMPGIVDTDTFEYAINFPFTINEENFEGVIKGGTPMVQVIPFKRDEFALEVYKSLSDYLEQDPDASLTTETFPPKQSYKQKGWHRKIYK